MSVVEGRRGGCGGGVLLRVQQGKELSIPVSNIMAALAQPACLGRTRVAVAVGMKTDRIRTDITHIIFVFIFLVGFGFEYG